MKLNKPSFPPGWILPCGGKIHKRLDQQQFVEVFILDSEEYLYLFHDAEVQKKVKVRVTLYDTYLINGREIIGRKYPTHKKEDITKRLKEIIERRGLDAIAGMKKLKSDLIKDVIQPFLNWKAYHEYGVSPSNGILLFGPPGCGKTFIARRLAEAINAEIIELSEGSVGSSYVHGTSRNIVQAFQKATEIAPCILFVDEISGLMPRRDELTSHYREAEINEFLMQIEGCIANKVLFVGATNFPEKIDPAVLRSGRIDKKIFVPPPDADARRELFIMLLEERPLSDDIEIDKLVELTDGLICSDLKLIVNNAALSAMQDNCMISMNILRDEASNFKPTLSQAELKQYQDFTESDRMKSRIGF